MTPEKFKEKMKNIAENPHAAHDTEIMRNMMTNLMCVVLADLGYSEGVAIFEEEM